MLAFPDRIARQRKRGSNRYLMANGSGVQLLPNDRLSQHTYLVILDCDGDPKEPYVRLACGTEAEQLRQRLKNRIRSTSLLDWDPSKQQVTVQNLEVIGAIKLSQTPVAKPWSQDIQQQAQQKLLQAIIEDQLQPLPWNETCKQLLSRIQWLHHQQGDQWPDVSTSTLIENAADWLLPYLVGRFSYSDLASLDLHSALLSMLPWDQQHQLNRQAPSHWPLATGRSVQIDYSDQGGPLLSAPMQAFYGVSQHPTLANGFPIRVQLLSPARRPLQITQDLANFWTGSYIEIAKEMRGRYPKHYWPPNPEKAEATERPKPKTK